MRSLGEPQPVLLDAFSPDGHKGVHRFFNKGTFDLPSQELPAPTMETIASPLPAHCGTFLWAIVAEVMHLSSLQQRTFDNRLSLVI